MPDGVPEPLGVTPWGTGVNVAVVAPDATALWFCLFDATGTVELQRVTLAARSGDVWHGFVPGVAVGARYGLRADGPRDAVHRFNPHKLLLDPWARATDRPFRLHGALWDNDEDSAPFMPKGVVCEALAQAAPPPLPGPRVVYELHVRGFTMLHPEVPEPLRGTFAGLAHPAAVAHLRALGVTHVELLPCAAGVDERHLPPLGLTNYWNYNPVALLAPCPKLAPGGMAEVRAAVDALRDAGIGVILDVVFNHTGEGDEFGPTLSLRGLANAAFHRLLPDGRYANDAGTGNTLALDRPWPLRLVMDALRHWAVQAGVDGFRLDLATTLGRRDDGFDPQAPLLSAMRQDPVLRDRIIIAEPWDIGPGGYQLGRFPPGWGEWNDRFRDDVRRFWRGDAGMLGALATRLAGSADVFDGARRGVDSVNYVTAHDGFTVRDLVSFEQRRNWANGEEGRDGSGENHSWNNGVEGETDDAAVTARRAADVRALLATLLLARGTPMLGMGDEAGRTQHGNNNAYAQDNALSWFAWPAMDVALRDFTARLVRARLRHPALHGGNALTAADVAWLTLDGAPLLDWSGARSVAMLLRQGDDRVLVVVHGAAEAATLHVPPPRDGHAWRLVADSAAPWREGAVRATEPLAPRSVVLLVEQARHGETAVADEALRELAAAAGISPAWHDLAGHETQVPRATLQALLQAMALPAASQAQACESLARLHAVPVLPAQMTVPAGEGFAVPLARRGRVELRLQREDGSAQGFFVGADEGAWRGACRHVAVPPQPPGNHVLHLGDAACTLAVVPRACFAAPAQRRFGIAAQAYALRRAADQGIGDYTAVAELARAAATQGAALLGLSPPHALSPLDRARASPYQPSDRRFLEPVLIDVAALPFDVGAALAAQAPVFAALRQRDSVDYEAVWLAKLAVLRAAWARFGPTHPLWPEFAAFRAEQGVALERFATFTAIAEQRGSTDARTWPVALRHGEAPGVAGFAAAHERELGFQAFLQWLADRQLADAARAGAGLYRDLAVGAAPDGAEVWAEAGSHLHGFSIGAPPDQFAPQGQVWGLPPAQPRAVVGSFARLLRANMRHATALRIDHVMALARLFVVPDGAPGAAGAYLAYPQRHLLGQLALASQRARCVVVGEDLGTVPPGFREELAAAEVLSYRVLWFERRGEGFIPPAEYPARAAACVATHDLPTLAGWWLGADLEERAALGLLGDAEAAQAARARERAALLAALHEAGIAVAAPVAGEAPPAAFIAAVHALAAATPSALVLVQAEDLAGETAAVNLPGTDRERPNWRRRLPLPVAALLATPVVQATLAALRGRAVAAGCEPRREG